MPRRAPFLLPRLQTRDFPLLPHGQSIRELIQASKSSHPLPCPDPAPASSPGTPAAISSAPCLYSCPPKPDGSPQKPRQILSLLCSELSMAPTALRWEARVLPAAPKALSDGLLFLEAPSDLAPFLLPWPTHSLPFFAQLQPPHWPPACGTNTPVMLLPQGLCTCFPRRPGEYSLPSSPHEVSQASAPKSPLGEALPG